MTYEEALDYIHGTLKFGVKLGLENMRLLLELMGNPHKDLKYIHVAGTNGKGSVTAFISSILMEAGYRVGVYTSPYIQRFTERIQVNRNEISPCDLARITAFVREKVELMVQRGANHPTEFEIVTAIAFKYFCEMGCDVVVLEVGLGGRFDSTNIIDKSIVSVITTISYDHMNILGSTLSEIAFEKAGIIKEDGEVLLYPQQEEVERVFVEACSKKNARLHKVSFDSVRINSFSIDGQEFDYGAQKSFHIGLLGEHQVRNAIIAIECARQVSHKGFVIPETAIRRGLSGAKWPGRLEVLSKKPVFIIDGAHNREGANALSNFLKAYFPGKKILFILGVLKDKEYVSFIEACVPLAYGFVAVEPDSERALPASELAENIKPYCNNVSISGKIEEAVKTSLEILPDDGVICAFGSLYYIGEIRTLFES